MKRAIMGLGFFFFSFGVTYTWRKAPSLINQRVWGEVKAPILQGTGWGTFHKPFPFISPFKGPTGGGGGRLTK